MSKVVDARGLTCPQPVILTKKAMEESCGDEVITIVDNTTALENVIKLAKSQGYEADFEEIEGGYHIRMVKSCDVGCSMESYSSVAVLVTGNTLGRGSDELGQVLMKSFIFTLSEMEPPVKQLMFLNSGVTLTAEDSQVIEQLRVLESKGVEILACGTCLDFYGLKDKLAVGKATNMYTIMDNLTNATKSLVF
ncbi:MAG: sulfurtransferase-like selenium metabolism protein YedF [Acidobacteriota bacterium]